MKPRNHDQHKTYAKATTRKNDTSTLAPQTMRAALRAIVQAAAVPTEPPPPTTAELSFKEPQP